jgi:uncharacterized protein (TIGR02246 family)
MDSSLEARVRRVEAIEEIRALKARYCEACDDDHNGERVAALFTPDGVWGNAGGTVNARGHAEIRAFFDSVRNAGIMRRSAHMVTNPIIEVDGDRATGRWRLVMLYTGAAEDGRPQYHRIIGFYEDAYVRVGGRWWFETLRVTVEESGPYAMEAAPAWPAATSG